MPDIRRGDDEQCWKKKTKLEKKLIVGSSILGTLALIFLLVILMRKSCVEKEEECTTKSCVEAAAEILEFIDLKENPCDDFYKYACGSYYKNAVKKDSPSPWSSTQVLFENEMKSLIVDPIRDHDSNAHVALKQFYHECMNETKIDEDDNEAFMDAIDDLGGWPLVNETSWNAASFDWVDWYIKAKSMGLPVTGFFHFEAMNTPQNETILMVTGPQMDHISKYRFLRLMKRISQAFEVPYNSAEELDLYNFRDKLEYYRYVPDDDEDDDEDEDDDDPTVTHIQNLTDICPDVPWLKILNGISGDSSQFDNSSKVGFYYDAMEIYCQKLQQLLGKTHPKAIANFYVWSIIHKAHNFMNKYVRRAYSDIMGEDDERFTTCYNSADERFKYVKETIYVRKKTNPKVKADILEMIEIMKELFMEHLAKCDWMDDITRSAAVEKVELIESVIGGDDELYDTDKFEKILGLDEFKFTSDNMFKMFQEKMIKENHHFFESLYKPKPENWKSFFKNAVAVNAYFVPSINVMIIPAPILTSIFYNRKFPAYMNYGPMESTIGHEFMHGFSKSARDVLLENDTIIDWWTNATAEGFDKKVQCVIDEYESIKFRYKLNGTLTLEENVADYVGADLGYEAYQRYVKKHGSEMKLPGIPLTPEQIYWVQTSTNFCFRKLDDNEVDYEEEDMHAIPAFRVQAPARNSIYFAEAFNCPVGSFMNPEVKCQII